MANPQFPDSVGAPPTGPTDLRYWQTYGPPVFGGTPAPQTISQAIAARGAAQNAQTPVLPPPVPPSPAAPPSPQSPFRQDVGSLASGLVGRFANDYHPEQFTAHSPLNAAIQYFTGTPESFAAATAPPNPGRVGLAKLVGTTPAEAAAANAPTPQNVGQPALRNVTVSGGGRSQNYSVPLGLTPEQHAGASNAIANAHLMTEEDFIAGLRGLPRFAVNQLVQRHLAFSPRDQALSEYLTMNRALADNAAATLPEGLNMNDAKAVAKARSAAINAARTNYVTNVERVAIPGMVPYTAGNVGIGPGGYPPQ